MQLTASEPLKPIVVDAKELARLLSVSIATLNRMKAAGKLPLSIPFSNGCVRWRRETIEAWIRLSEERGELIDQATWQSIMQSRSNGDRSNP